MNTRVQIAICAISLLMVTGTAGASGHTKGRKVKPRPAAQGTAKRAAVPARPAAKAPTPTIAAMGAFARPAILPFDAGMTVKQAIEAAGGFREEADAEHVTLRRAGAPALAVINGSRALADDPIQNAPLMPGDVLMVMPRPQPPAAAPEAPAPAGEPPAAEKTAPAADQDPPAPTPKADKPVEAPKPPADPGRIRFDGEVADPGLYEYEKITVGEAIRRIGGLSKRADAGRIAIHRGLLTDPAADTEIKYDLNKVSKGDANDVELEPGDVIVVPRRSAGWNLGRLLPPRKVMSAITGAIKKIGIGDVVGIIPGAAPVLGAAMHGK